MNSEGELVVNSSRHRTQKCARARAPKAAALPRSRRSRAPPVLRLSPRRQNYEDALEKLQAMIDTAATPPQGPSAETIKKVKSL